uniref:Cytochrome b n=1 Tax=Ibidoecus plataleae TaxID=3004258 RepID=A0A9E9J1X2_9NEOP|nr:cytochrome b [Ibidoecus plataleae]
MMNLVSSASVPIPANLSYMWNFGSLLGLSLVIQLVSGVFLSMHYSSALEGAFESVLVMMTDLNSGWVVRSIHANGASMFFLFIYLHVGRGLYYGSFNLITWPVGVLMLLLLMAISFMGYVLPWGQMSFWGATVITNLVGSVPYVGSMLVNWLWGGFSVSGPTLSRFFSFHFVSPFILLSLAVTHVYLLHSTGSSNPLGISPNSLKVNFHPYFSWKDLLGVGVCLTVFMMISTSRHDVLMDPDNFMEANPMVTPVHIQPEWYFLFAYAILRSISNKLGGVVALAASIVILILLPLLSSGKNNGFNPFFKGLVGIQFSNFMILTWLGCMPIEYPFVMMSQATSVAYFTIMVMIGLMCHNSLWMKR